ncbi:uncharacterized protein F23B12.7-like [Bradysia coprophila]|uniref:uncharacterized protein F23B12.7-like n=1 Tax=Bradysia coprophila TaxID=38358 RepID=UPI00187DC8D8|nr:uncharacterized protein F23B12.7-like [Bradysia coprophila]
MAPRKESGENEIAEKVTQIVPSKYNPYQRTPAFAGAEFVLKTELLKLADYFHPSLKVFAKNLIDEKPISFYGDPLRDFCLTQFLDRFAFRNPKKPSEDVKSQSMVHLVHNKNYTASGGRGLPVKELTTSNCSEDEKFILEYLQQKREKRAAFATDAEDDDVDSVNDDEFDAYLDGLGGKDDDLDFMNDLGNELKDDAENKKDKKKKQKVDEDKEEENDGDWDDEDVDDAGDGASDIENDGTIDEENDSDDDGSISLADDSDDDASVFDGDEDDDENIFEESDPEDEPKSKKLKGMSGKDFQKTLKNTDNMNSLFAAAEDFAECWRTRANRKRMVR